MKRVLTTLTLLITLCSFAFGQDNYFYFGEVPTGYQANMSMQFLVEVDGVQQDDQVIEIAAYIDGELRAVTKRSFQNTGAPEPYNGYYYRQLLVQGDESDNGKAIIFKAYNHDTKEELTSLEEQNTLEYAAQTTVLPSTGMRLYFTSPEPVAKVGNTEYSNIDEAIANWTANTTLTLLDNVTLSDVITLKSTEHHILDLSTYTMTAASGKNAIEITCNGLSNATYALTINADADEPGGITATGKACIYYKKTESTKDRPIIRVNNGVFEGSYSINSTSSNGNTNCPQFHINGGTFNSYMNLTKAMLIIKDGFFNCKINCTGDVSAYRLISGGIFIDRSWQFMTTGPSGNEYKFTVGKSKNVFNCGVYVDDNSNLVVGDDVITEAGEMFEASTDNYSGWSSYLQYSSAKENGLYYTDALICLKDNDKTTGSVNVYADQLDLTSLNYKGTINISKTLAVTFNEGTTPAWTVASTVGDVAYNDVTDNGIVTRTYTVITPVAELGETQYYTLAAAVEAATGGQTITLLRDAEGAGVVINKNVTIDFGGHTYTFNEGVGSTGTESNGFQILKGNTVTLMHGTLNVAQSAASTFYTIIQNYANLTINDMTLDGTNLDKWSSTDGDSYVVSINSGNVNITGNTTIIANDNSSVTPSKAFAFDACDQTNKDYSLPTVTVNTTGAIKGAVEVSATLNIEALGEGSEISYISIDGKGQLFHNGLTTTIKKNVVASSSWSTLSAPTQERKAVFNTEAEKHDFYQYVESAENEWDYIGDKVEDNSYTMDPGRGYLYATNAEVSFTGTLNHETVTYPLSYTATQNLAGFHLIGNPFTHNISFAHLDGNIVEGYYVVGENNEFIAVEPTTSTEVIAPFQAVLVQATEAAGNLAINKEVVSATREVSNGVLEIVATNGSYSDVAYVSFNEGYGLEKMAHNNANVPMVYLPVGDKNYAIAKYNQDVNEIPVSFVAQTMGEYTIGVKSHDCAFESMYLTDRMTGERVNLLLEDYTFIATSNDNADRFMLTFATTGVEETKEESYIFINNDNMIINNVAGNAIVRIVDMMGRVVSEYNVRESASISTSSLNSGVYVIQMSDDNGVKVQKVVIE